MPKSDAGIHKIAILSDLAAGSVVPIKAVGRRG
jgi:hypothetical protein